MINVANIKIKGKLGKKL